MSYLIRIFFLPAGLLKYLFDAAVDGSRDIANSIRYKGAIVDRGCCINERSRLADNSRIQQNTYFLNSSIGQYSYVGRNSLIQNAEIGAFCSIANDVCIGLGAHPISNFSTSPVFYRRDNPLKVRLIDRTSDFVEYHPIAIANDVWIGARAIIMDGVKVGNGAVIAANSVVTKDVPDYAIVGGVPARILKFRFSEEKINSLLDSHWWSWPIDEILARQSEISGAPEE